MSKREEWASLTGKERAQLLKECLDTAAACMQEVAAETARVKGTYGSGCGDELLCFVPIICALDEYAAALRAEGHPRPNSLRQRGNGQWVADVFPRGMDNIAYGGAVGEVWIKPGAEPSQGKMYREKAAGKAAAPAGVAVVLAAGNHLNVAVMDLLHQLIVHDCVAALKMNPANDYTGPQLERVLAPLQRRGFFTCLYGGPDVAQKLVHHSDVVRVHMTGAAATYDAIMWGPGKPKTGTPLLQKPFEAELGCVTPTIIVPCHKRWSAADLEYHAESLVSSKLLNAGHNCNASEIIVTARDWPQRAEFMQAVRRVLDRTPQRWAWYPGSEAKYAAFRKQFPNAHELGQGLCTRERCTSPFLLAEGLQLDEAQTRAENWCAVMQEVALDVPGSVEHVGAFLEAAVAFCNDRCMGTLSTAVIIHPSTQAAHSAAYQRALEDLRYGHITVNAPAIIGFAFPATPWGAWGAAGTAEDIGSGNALGANTSLFDHVEKGVVYVPWRLAYKPLWFGSHTNLEGVVPKLADYVRSRNVLSLSMIVPQALMSP